MSRVMLCILSFFESLNTIILNGEVKVRNRARGRLGLGIKMGLFDFWFHTQQQTAAPKFAPKTTCKKL